MVRQKYSNLFVILEEQIKNDMIINFLFQSQSLVNLGLCVPRRSILDKVLTNFFSIVSEGRSQTHDLRGNGRLDALILRQNLKVTNSYLTFFFHSLPSKTYLLFLLLYRIRSLSPHLGAFIFSTVSSSNSPVTFRPANF